MFILFMLMASLSLQQDLECKFKLTPGRKDQYVVLGDYYDYWWDDKCVGKLFLR